MGIEIERKFLVSSERWRAEAKRSECIEDGLLSVTQDRKTRVRITGSKATLTVKTKRVKGRREEFEYEIPLADARRLLEHCGTGVLQKLRHYVDYMGLTWEIDEYQGLLKGVILAEVEVEAIDQPIAIPQWVGREVTETPEYRKINMLKARRGADGNLPTSGASGIPPLTEVLG